jgi:hypothetical protein
LRPSGVLRQPERLVYLVQQGVAAIVELLSGAAGSIPKASGRGVKAPLKSDRKSRGCARA